MSEVREAPDVIAAAEGVEKENRYAEYVFPELESWIERDFPDEFRKPFEQTENYNPKNAEKLAKLQSDLARTLYLFSKDPLESKTYEERLSRLLLSNDRNSIPNKVGRNPSEKNEVREDILGSISVLTATDFINQTHSGTEIGVMREVVASPYEDAHHKVDLKFDLGIRNKDGKRVISQVQLKAHGEEDVRIARVWEEHGGRKLGVPERDLNKMYNRGKTLEKTYMNEKGEREEIEVRSFVFLVPKANTRSVNNVYGEVKNHKLLEIFEEEAKREGFYE